ncbi:MAG: hypothetical protein IPJ77_02930 [Planctomycetes bacterium]|nr:hypothetical protein [Planctomycetota bacterium]
MRSTRRFVLASIRVALAACGAVLGMLHAPLHAQAAPPPADTGRPITILVTAAVGDGGVKDAEVIVLYWEDLKKDWGEMKITPLFSDWDEARQKHGHKFTTDYGGTCIVPRPATKAYVTVRIPGQFGFSQLDSTDVSPFLMKLEVDQAIAVQVVDPQGNPVQGIAVGANMPVVRTIKDRLDEDKVVWLVNGITGSDGVAWLRNLQWWREPPFKELRENPTYYQLEVASLFKQRVFAKFDPDRVPSSPVRLVVPATGRVVVPLPTGQRAYARLRAALPGTDFDKRPWPLKVPYRNEGTDGRAVFPHVELGVEVEYEVWWSGLAAPRRGKAKGPTKPGEEVTLPRLDSFEDPNAKGAPKKG